MPFKKKKAKQSRGHFITKLRRNCSKNSDNNFGFRQFVQNVARKEHEKRECWCFFSKGLCGIAAFSVFEQLHYSGSPRLPDCYFRQCMWVNMLALCRQHLKVPLRLLCKMIRRVQESPCCFSLPRLEKHKNELGQEQKQPRLCLRRPAIFSECKCALKNAPSTTLQLRKKAEITDNSRPPGLIRFPPVSVLQVTAPVSHTVSQPVLEQAPLPVPQQLPHPPSHHHLQQQQQEMISSTETLTQSDVTPNSLPVSSGTLRSSSPKPDASELYLRSKAILDSKRKSKLSLLTASFDGIWAHTPDISETVIRIIDLLSVVPVLYLYEAQFHVNLKLKPVKCFNISTRKPTYPINQWKT